MFLALFLGCRADPGNHARAGEAAPPGAVDWVRQRAVHLSTTDPVDDDRELAAFGEAVDGARVVALGEATHGTHEFFRLKHRLIEYLVRHQSFRHFALEADGAGACALDDYLQTGQGDPERLLRDLKFWTWDTRELAGLIRWMRTYNQTAAPTEGIHFHGIDMQNPLPASRVVTAFLREVDPEAAGRAEKTYSCLGPLEDPDAIAEQYPRRPPEEQVQCGQQIAKIYEGLAQNRDRFDRSAAKGYACALWSARLIQESEVLFRVQSVRDHYSAENVIALLEPPGSTGKVIVWAHNNHIANAFGVMGRRLKNQLGRDYRAIGFTFYEGSFRARPRTSGGGAGRPIPIVPPLPASDSYEQAFHRTGLPLFFVDLQPAAGIPPSAGWLTGPHPLWQVGGAYAPGHSTTASRLPEEFDGMVFVNRTTPSELLSPEPRPRSWRNLWGLFK